MAIVERHDDTAVAVPVQGDGLSWNRQPGAELFRLHQGPFGEFAAGQPGGEGEVVLDPRCSGSLAAAGDTVDQHGAQSVGCGVDRGGQSGGPAPTIVTS